MNLKIAYHCALASDAAFRDGVTSRSMFNSLGYDFINFDTDPDTSTELYICHETDHPILGTHTLVTFKASKEWQDWVTNFTFSFKKIDFYNAKAHRGFVRAVYSVYKRLLQVVSDLPGDVYVCGHSLGGALAVFAAAMLDNDGIPIRSVYTFGSPRVFNRKGAKAYNKNLPNTFRFEVAGDTISRMPKPFMGYRHVGYHFYFDTSGHMLFQPEKTLTLYHNVKDMISEFREGEIFDWEDHKIALYQHKIKSEMQFRGEDIT